MDMTSYLLGKKAGSGGGTEVIANPELVGTEDDLTGLQVGDTKYKVDNLEHYSTTEQVVGTWIDGKPLYQKCITGTMTSSERVVTILKSDISPNLDKYCYLGGIVMANGGTGHPIPYWKGSTDYTGVFIAGGTEDVLVDCGSQHGYGDFVLTIKYTKTTD